MAKRQRRTASVLLEEPLKAGRIRKAEATRNFAYASAGLFKVVAMDSQAVGESVDIMYRYALGEAKARDLLVGELLLTLRLPATSTVANKIVGSATATMTI